jgi:LDH2 family malate/lactate/ureidoglycolate dehydrogenase
VFYPGEIEQRLTEERQRDGISIPDGVLAMLETLAADPAAVR